MNKNNKQQHLTLKSSVKWRTTEMDIWSLLTLNYTSKTLSDFFLSPKGLSELYQAFISLPKNSGRKFQPLTFVKKSFIKYNIWHCFCRCSFLVLDSFYFVWIAHHHFFSSFTTNCLPKFIYCCYFWKRIERLKLNCFIVKVKGP